MDGYGNWRRKETEGKTSAHQEKPKSLLEQVKGNFKGAKRAPELSIAEDFKQTAHSYWIMTAEELFERKLETNQKTAENLKIK